MTAMVSSVGELVLVLLVLLLLAQARVQGLWAEELAKE